MSAEASWCEDCRRVSSGDCGRHQQPAGPESPEPDYARILRERAEPTLRDLFAMNAPGTPGWFQHAPYPAPDPMPPKGSAERLEWLALNGAARLIQWRWFYADSMLAGRSWARKA